MHPERRSCPMPLMRPWWRIQKPNPHASASASTDARLEGGQLKALRALCLRSGTPPSSRSLRTVLLVLTSHPPDLLVGGLGSRTCTDRWCRGGGLRDRRPAGGLLPRFPPPRCAPACCEPASLPVAGRPAFPTPHCRSRSYAPPLSLPFCHFPLSLAHGFPFDSPLPAGHHSCSLNSLSKSTYSALAIAPPNLTTASLLSLQ